MLVVLKEIPRSREEWDRWGFHHRTSHDAIRQGIQKDGGPNLTDYPLYPISETHFADFLNANAQTHIDMNGVLGAQGSDLLEVDPTNPSQLAAWIDLHFLEHQTAELRLKI